MAGDKGMTGAQEAVSDATARALADEARRVRSFIASNRSDTLLRLFDFLVQQSLAGCRPRESDIADALFAEDTGAQGQQGSRVRVGVYRLRKKLDLFYADKPGPRLIIPQGEYGLLLETAGVSTRDEAEEPADISVPSRPFSRPVVMAMSLLLIGNALAALLYFSHDFRKSGFSDHSETWKSFGMGGKDTFVVVGDYFMFSRKNADGRADDLVQDFSIKSVDDFYNKDFINGKLSAAAKNEDKYTVSSDLMAPLGRLMSYIRLGSTQPVTSSDVDPDMMQSSNILYLGSLDAMSPLLSGPLFEASTFRCGATCYELIDTSSGRHFLSDSPYLLEDRIIPRRDYGYIASYPGPSGHQIVLLSGTGDAGAAQMANVLMDDKMLDQLRRQVGGRLRSFEALYQVRTMFNRSYASTLLIARPLNSERMWDKTMRDQ